VTLRSGLVLLTKSAAADTPRLSLTRALKPVEQLGQTLKEIEARFGAPRREWVGVELEYPATSR
jgi:hypothetical protein